MSGLKIKELMKMVCGGIFMAKAQIFNISLNILGISTPLENPNSTDNRAILLNNYYELARDYV